MKYCCFSVIKLSILVVFLLSFAFNSHGQVTSLSPYSRFGIGTILPQGSAVQLGLGGNTVGLVDNYTVFTDNPASYSFLYNTSFDLGIRGSSLQISNADQSQRYNFGSVSHFSLVFKRQGGKAAYALGLDPYSTTGYSITDKQSVSDIGDVSFTYDGDGGINKAHAGFSYRFDLLCYKGLLDKKENRDSVAYRHNLSLGTNLNYYFGSLNQIRRVLYAEPEFLHTRISSSTHVSDVNLNFGMQGLFLLKNKWEGGERVGKTQLMVGASYVLGTKLNSDFREISETIRFFSGAEVVIDTVQFVENTSGVINLPQRLALGLGIKHINKNDRTFIWVGNFFAQDWSSSTGEFGGVSETQFLTKAKSISTGIEFTPKPFNKSTSAWQRSVYRIGGRITDTYLNFSGTQISERAVSFGMSIPMIKSQTFPPSRINLGMEIGSRGTTEDNLIKESFVNFSIGFSLTPHMINKWFVQRKYD